MSQTFARLPSKDSRREIKFKGLLSETDYKKLSNYLEETRTKDIDSFAMKSIFYFLSVQKIKKNIKYSVFGILIATGSITLLKALFDLVAPYFGLSSS